MEEQMLYEEIQSFWSDRLVTFNSEILRTLPLSENDLWFLEHIGLPHLNDLWFTKLASSPEQLFVKSYHHHLHVVIGRDEPTATELAIRIADRAVISFVTDGKYTHCFVNHTLPTFILFLKKFTKGIIQNLILHNCDNEAEAQQQIDLVENELKQIDPYAFYHAETWWSQVFEDLRYQFWYV